MAYIRKRRDSYKVEIRKKGYPHINRSFIDLKNARKFARDIEIQKVINFFKINMVFNKSNFLKHDFLIKI